MQAAQDHVMISFKWAGVTHVTCKLDGQTTDQVELNLIILPVQLALVVPIKLAVTTHKPD